MPPLTLRFVQDPQGIISIEAREGERQAHGTSLTTDAGNRLLAISPTPALRPVLLSSHWTQAEERAGNALLHALGAGAVAHTLQQRFGAGIARKEMVPLCLQLPTEALQALPWELLAEHAGGLPAETQNLAVVARQVQGAQAELAPAAPRLRVATWSLTPEDTVCRTQMGILDELALIHTNAPALMVSENAAPPAEPGDALVLFIVSHGVRADDAVGLWRPDGALDAGSAGQWLLPWLRRASMVVLSTCWGGGEARNPSDVPATRFVTVGARAVVGPRLPCSGRAAAAFAGGLIQALVQGDSLVSAVVAGRRRVAGLGAAHEDSRWHNHRLFLADGAVLEWSPVVTRGAADASRLLDATWAEARDAGLGYVGVEHLAFALARGAGHGLLAGYIRALLAPVVQRLMKQIMSLRASSMVAEPVPTPRLKRLMDVAAGDQDTLLRALGNDPGHRLHDLVDASLLPAALLRSVDAGSTFWDATLTHMDPGQAPVQGDGPLALEVLGGPEDGRRIAMTPGLRIGGPDSGAEEVLYRATTCMDERLGIRCILVLDGRTIETSAPLQLHRRGGKSGTLSGRIELMAGDELRLTNATRLRVLAEAR